MKVKTVKTRFIIFICSIGAVYLSSCEQNDYKKNISIDSISETGSYDAIPNHSETITSSNTPLVFTDLKIIKSANVRYKVTQVKIVTSQIRRLAHKYGGYVAELQFENNLYSLENRFTIKIPQQYFDTLMDSIVEFSEFVDHERVTTKDVTEEYIDIQTRLKTKLELKERYESILRKNAKTVEDILATEEKLSNIQEEIETSQGKLNYFTNKIAFSTIQIDLYETVDYKEEPNSYTKTFWSKSKDALAFGWNFIESLTLGLFHIWPLLTLGCFITFLIKKKKIKDYQKKKLRNVFMFRNP